MQEKIIQGLDLVVKYQRGMLYLAAYKTAQECGTRFFVPFVSTGTPPAVD